jgi:outer membrane protein TolC
MMIGRMVSVRRAGIVLSALLAAATHDVSAQPQAAQPQATQAQDTLRLTLAEVVERTLRASPQYMQARGSVQTAESAERTALGAFLPNLNFSSGASLSSTQRWDSNNNTWVSGASNDSYNAGLSTSIDLFTGGRRGADLARTRAQTAASEAALVEQRYAVTRDAKAGFFAVLRATDLIRSAEARLKRAEESLGAAERRAQVGSATRSDVLRAQLEVTNSRQALLQAQNEKRATMFVLGRLAGVDGPVDARTEQPLVVVDLPLTREQLLELVLAQSPAVVTAEANLRTASAAVRASRAAYFPSLNGSGSYNWSNEAASLNNVRGSWSMRLGLSFPLFNRFQREESLERSNVQARVAEYQIADARRLARANLERVLGTLETARQQITLAEQALTVAEEDLRVQQERYRLGVSTILEQVTSQENLVGAEAALIAARYDYQLALADLERAMGTPLR